jgi:hypothetical protein
MKLFSALSAFLLLLLSAAVPARAERTFGLAGDYLNYGAGARALAMGGAFTGLADDASAEYYNPAAVAFVDEYQLSSMFASFGLGTNLYYLSAAFPMGPWGAVAASDLMSSADGFQGRNDVNQVTQDNQSITQNAAALSYAYAFQDLWSAGVKAKFLREQMFSNSGDALGLDLSLYSRPIYGVSAGLSVANVNRPRITLIEDPDVFGRDVKFGVAYHAKRDFFIATLDVNKLEEQKMYYAAGLEINPYPILSLRAGWNQQNELTAGLGINFRILKVDYAFSNSSDFGAYNKISFTYRWGNVYQTGVKIQGLAKETDPIYVEGLYNEVKFKTSLPGFSMKGWSLVISDEEGKTVRELKGEARPPETVVWDMLDDAGKPVKRGKYRFSFKVVYKNDKSWVEKGRFRLDYKSENAPKVDIELNGAPSTAPVPPAKIVPRSGDVDDGKPKGDAGAADQAPGSNQENSSKGEIPPQ